ncbi:MAG: sigma-54-dependent Fis family transcriptional regulator [Deltaproteobacteria bacterium]|nr:sigma-54-dependent Fis family transcriptional regulator [Deltaproteobacteria bacterium]
MPLLGETAERNLEIFVEFLVSVVMERSPEGILRSFEEYLSKRPTIARFCIWLAERAEEGPLLRLASTRGRSATGPAEWRRPGGDYRVVGCAEPVIGRAAAEGKQAWAGDQGAWDRGRPAWAGEAGFLAYIATPFLHDGEVQGVFAVFYDHPVSEYLDDWRKRQVLMGQYLAAALANARALQEIEGLRARLAEENEYLRDEVRDVQSFGPIVGGSAALRRLVEQVALVAPTEASVLLLGESGTGKELVARALHEGSRRRDGPLVRVNCASVPRELFESEFFGHIRGAFTGALRDRAGRFELADGGTLFLDEVGEIPLELQAKLLRVLQEGTYERIGDEKTRKVDVRLVAATNRPLATEAAAGRFRQDLYFRLSVFPIEVPPLRERPEDIPDLARHFLRLTSRRLGLPEPSLKRGHLLALQAYDWPGNVRELQNVIERALILGRGRALYFPLPGQEPAPEPVGPQASPVEQRVLTEDELRALERRNVARALERAGWKTQGPGSAAEFLGVAPTTLRTRLKALGVERRPGGGAP